MNTKEILKELQALGRDGYKNILLKHGVREPCYGVKIGDLKKILKKAKGDHELALALYDTGVYDAMYLAGLMADDHRMTKKDLRRWLSQTQSAPLADWTVPWVASGSPHGWDLALAWIDAKRELTVRAGWATLSCWVAVKPDSDLDLAMLRRLLQRVQRSVHQAPGQIGAQMNMFVISVGTYVAPLTPIALRTAEAMGPVSVDRGETACQVPPATDYIRQVQKRGAIGKKRKTAKC